MIQTFNQKDVIISDSEREFNEKADYIFLIILNNPNINEKQILRYSNLSSSLLGDILEYLKDKELIHFRYLNPINPVYRINSNISIEDLLIRFHDTNDRIIKFRLIEYVLRTRRLIRREIVDLLNVPRTVIYDRLRPFLSTGYVKRTSVKIARGRSQVVFYIDYDFLSNKEIDILYSLHYGDCTFNYLNKNSKYITPENDLLYWLMELESKKLIVKNNGFYSLYKRIDQNTA